MVEIVRFLKSEFDQTQDAVDLAIYTVTLLMVGVLVVVVGWLVWVAGMLWARQ